MAGTLHFGLWQQTSEQAVRQRQRQQQSSYGAVTAISTGPRTTVVTTTEVATSAAGIKRSHDSSSEAGLMPPPTKKRAALPSLPARLAASAIDEVVSVGSAPASSTQNRLSWLAPGSSEYSQRRTISATPTAAANPKLSLAHPCYGLPPALIANFVALGICSIYPWQMHCLLSHHSILAGKRNLVYAAPTGGGKSLVADVLMLRQVLQSNDGIVGNNTGAGFRDFRRRSKALLVLPFVALVQEKVRWLRRVVAGVPRSDAQSIGSQTANGPSTSWQRHPAEDTVRVVGFFGGAKIRATWADFDIGVATIEKANALINTAIDDGTISDLKVIVLDELHMVDDSHRGYIFELMATKLLCLDHSVQINMDLLATWLRAYSYETRYRPIPIEEHLVYDGEIYVAEEANRRFLDALTIPDKKETAAPTQPLRIIQPSGHRELQDSVTNAVVSLANETARSGYGALVFSSSRAASESDALLISRVMPTPAEVDPAVSEARLDLVSTLRGLNTGLDSVLSQTVPVGVAFHHAGMTTEERDLIANAYDNGVLKVCVATCGLAAGINLPARRVILHNARMGRELIGPAMLRQMRGRAGRKGKDEVGETYLCCRGADVDDMLDLMHAELPHISSCLQEDKRRLQRALLEVITVRLATSPESVHAYVEKTLLYHSVVNSCADDGIPANDGQTAAKADLQPLWADVETSLETLQRMGFVSKGEFGDYEPTRFGKAVVASALDPEDAVFIHSELERALQAFVLDGEMHVLYTFTPVHDTIGTAINWRRFWEEMEQLDESGLRVLHFLGLKPSIISKMLRGGTLKESTPEEKETARIYRRFYLALQLRDLCNEMPIHRVAQKYDSPRGAVQNLEQTCEGFAAGMIKFCEHMDWGAMASVLEHFVDRLKAGAKADLLALAKIAFVKSRTARVFWENGFKTVATVANTDPRELVPVLMQAQASKVLFEDRNDDKFQETLLEKARIITESANRIWQLGSRIDGCYESGRDLAPLELRFLRLDHSSCEVKQESVETWALSAAGPITDTSFALEAIFSIEGKLLEMKSRDYYGNTEQGKPAGALAIIEAKNFWAREDAIDGALQNVDFGLLRPVVQPGGISYGRLREAFELLRLALATELGTEAKGLKIFL
ncbi:DNA-directed DNA polymerase [Grosmannia clavigera kw1407]|uniref:DNA-directed DNA polymerase n=1 Tax=Grosmannia clavigera (strain kw1407 / UAMH 11150) TaxID=655863 RepID=F0XS38_GROCL|nr:DNA-directed DNA polymerase [Grosmannia clavigera kw1407]EFW99536.1 DNA-directed DNA polymerase [Grosmannia clavigera kw1407]